MFGILVIAMESVLSLCTDTEAAAINYTPGGGLKAGAKPSVQRAAVF